MTRNEDRATSPLPRSYYVWLSGALTSILGDAVLYFALGWAAATHGGTVAGLVLTAINLPRVLLLIVGGTVGDRFGARRVMIAGDSVMLVGTIALAVFAHQSGPAVWLLVAAGVLVGINDAFYLPASGSMPLRLVGKESLPRALAMRQGGAQLVTFIAGPLGGFLVATGGLTGTALLNAATFTVVLVIVIAIRPIHDIPPAKGSGSFLHDALDGIAVGWKDPVLRPALIATGGVAGFLLPVIPLLLPLLARDQGWGAGRTGVVFGVQSLGLLAVSLFVMVRGTLPRPGLVATAGMLVSAAGTATFVVSSAVAIPAALLVGAGSGLFASHIGPLVLMSAPHSHLSRMQALLTLVQSVSLLAMNNVLGNLARLTTATTAVLVCAAAMTATGAAALCSRALRTTTTAAPEPQPVAQQRAGAAEGA
ncbi:MFS transporter [Streptomyces sp. NPDC042319]|uniref:MFS transporter n=1 Tax=Streptomyces sp. NPDC042319 TaxID=3154332 RepID=UPI0033ED4EB5